MKLGLTLAALLPRSQTKFLSKQQRQGTFPPVVTSIAWIKLEADNFQEQIG